MHFSSDGRQIVTCTGHGQIRVYDPQTPQRHPVTQIEWGQDPFSCLDIAGSHQVVAANSKGAMGIFDLRGKGRLVQTYKGAAGAIRAIQVHPSAPFVASCGADRFLRAHHLHSKQLLHKIYCKVPLTSLLMRRNLSILDEDQSTERKSSAKTDAPEDSSGSESDDSDEIWAVCVI